MTTKPPRTLLPLVLLAPTLAAAALLGACAPAPVRVTVRATAEPTAPPPAVRVVRVTCASTHYYRQGRYHWLRGRYVFRKGRCVRRPSTWHAGCRIVPGRWVRRGGRYEYRPPSTLCRSVTTISHPMALPPPLRPPRRCGARHYLQRGHWQWVGGKWRWRPGRCVVRPRQWAAQGCRYQPGSWRRVGKRILHTKGGIVCRSRPCPRNHYRHRGKCLRRGVRRCTRAMRKAGRCR